MLRVSWLPRDNVVANIIASDAVHGNGRKWNKPVYELILNRLYYYNIGERYYRYYYITSVLFNSVPPRGGVAFCC
jgi:hypothetical protein